LGLRVRAPFPLLVLSCSLPMGIAQEVAERTVPAPHDGESLTELASLPEEFALPRELKVESAIYLQRRIGYWTEVDARRLFGEPRRRRYASDGSVVTGDIYAFADPTGRYREFELLFDRHSRKLSTIFIYPWHMTWRDCRELWGDDANATRVANESTFRSYRDRRLDVLLDRDGMVINLGVY
jgi:hypothetical protein